MNRNRVKWGFGLLALVLVFGLSGCGSEPAPVVQPPAPPPAPPPFQPQPVEVALGEHGGTLTLMTAEGGGYTLNGEAFAGGDIEAENGNMYMLALEDGVWTAAYQAPPAMEVMLGEYGGAASLMKSEDGSYWIGEMAIESGGSVTGSNGMMYTLTMNDEGLWAAAWVKPDAMPVMLGSSGASIMIQQSEDGTYWIGEMAIESGGSYMADNGMYMLSMDDAGMWMAVYQAAMVMVELGISGDTITLMMAEDGTYWLGEDEVMAGKVVTAMNGNMYTLSMDDEGMWMATYNPVNVVVALGTQGSVMLMMAEDMSWWLGDMAVMDGSEVMSASGNRYTLMMADGSWSARFEPEMMEIGGTGLVAMTREDRMGYDVGDDMVDGSGTGDVNVGGAMYHIMMNEDGMLTGTRFDTAIHTGTDMSLRIGLPTLSSDDKDTAANELRTHLELNGDSFPVSELLEGGMSDLMGDNFVAEALEEIMKLRDAVDAYIALDGTDDTTGDYDPQIRDLWNTDAQADVDSIFGLAANGTASKVPLKTLSASDDAEDAVEMFDMLLAALASADAFAAATEEDGDGVLEDAKLSAEDAMDIFDAVQTMSSAGLGMTGNTRFGAYWKQERDLASDDLKHVDADSDTDAGGTSDTDETTGDMGKIGAFAYSVIDDVTKTIDLPDTGNLQYEGETVAVTSGESPGFYFGEIAIQVRLVNKTVHGLVTNLRDAEGTPWVHQFGEVDSIRLSPAKLGANANWATDGLSDEAYINYSIAAGSPPSTQVDGGFTGELTGQEDTDDPARAAHGIWWIAETNAASDLSNTGGAGNKNLLTAGFGAERVEAAPEFKPPEGAIGDAETSVLPAARGTDEGSVTIDDDGQLVLVIDPDTGTADSDLQTIELALSSLNMDAETTDNGPTHIAETVEFIEQQRTVLEGWIALDATSDEASNDTDTLAGRDAVWTAIRNRVIGENGLGGDASAIFSVPGDRWTQATNRTSDAYNFMAGGLDADGNPTFTATDYPRDGTEADDVKGLATIDELLEALASADDLEDELEDGGIFHDVGGGFTTVAAGDVFGRKAFRTKVWFASTDYTRFGAWRRQTTPEAESGYVNVNGVTDDDGGTSDGPGAFAYSSLAPTTYSSLTDPTYPGGGTARYSGETVAVQLTVFYQGTIDVVVMWDAADFEDSDVAVTISGLANPDGVPLANGGADVGQIVLSGDDVTTKDADNNLGIAMSAATTRIVHADRSVLDDVASNTGSLTGKFVGKTIDGPMGVIGTWTAKSTGLGNGGTLRGAFGAEVGGP